VKRFSEKIMPKQKAHEKGPWCHGPFAVRTQMSISA
jgi:hypothetical protein